MCNVPCLLCGNFEACKLRKKSDWYYVQNIDLWKEFYLHALTYKLQNKHKYDKLIKEYSRK